ncbi:MAG TPA: glycosyltransferase family 4 protein [Trebonia sp.]|nr:glycosyltransferase family 4 protein [Trebonia sp.]
MNRPLRIALLSYRSKPHSGGQGVYVRHLSRELCALGHHVEVFSGQPYPELDDGPVLRKVPSLDLYREDDPFRTPHPREIRDWTDALETAMMWGGSFPEPLTFSIRALRALRARPGEFDIVHDNQGLGYGMLGVPRLGLPLVTSIHHPITVDKRLDLAGRGWLGTLSRRRWYGFVRMQGRVARRAGPLITVSESSKRDICQDFRVRQGSVHIVPLGVDTRRYRPRDAHAGASSGTPRVPGRIVAVASSDHPLKGLATLLRAVAKLTTERDAHLVVIGSPSEETRKLAAQLSLNQPDPPGGTASPGPLANRGATFVSGLPEEEYAELLASAEIAVVPSLYEGFSLPAVEHMASGTPLVATKAGALPEVTGDAAVGVKPGDAEDLAAALRRLLDSPEEREALSRRGVDRVQTRFAWPAVATATVALYRKVINGESAC